MGMKRAIIVYNKRSSRAGLVRDEVIQPMQGKAGFLVGKYEILRTNVWDNAERLAKVIQDGDMVIAAGGDGTATIALNGIMRSGKIAELVAVPYGNFNDMARALEGKGGKIWYPLEVRINGEHFWYVGGYFSVGMFAKSTGVFDEKEEREKLQRRQGGVAYSIMELAKWYFGKGRKERLPMAKLNGELLDGKTTDFLVINCGTVAKIMKAKDYGEDKEKFYVSTGRLGAIGRLMGYMAKSIVREIPGEKMKGVVLDFLESVDVAGQVEGEYQKIRGVEKIEIKKANLGIKIAKKVW